MQGSGPPSGSSGEGERLAGNFWDGITRTKKVTIASRLQQRHEKNLCRIFDATLPLSGATVLDAGCGEGRWTGYLSSHAKKVIGIDSSPASIKKAKRNVPGARFFVGDLTRLPFKDSSFDVVFLSLVLQHIVDETRFQKAVQELARVTRPGGRIFLLEIVSGIEKKRHGYIALRSAGAYQEAFLPHHMVRHIGVRFPYFSHAALFLVKKVVLRRQVGDVRDTYALYERMDSSRMRPLFTSVLLIAHWCSLPFTKAASRLQSLSPERIMVFTVKKKNNPISR